MFVIVGFIVLSLYNGIRYKEFTVDGKVKLPVECNSFFLYFILPLYVFSYFGSLHYSNPDSLGVAMQVLFVICLVICYIIIFSWAGINKHLMTGPGPKGNSEFCFPETLNVSRGEAEGNTEGPGETKLTVSHGASILMLKIFYFSLHKSSFQANGPK